MTVTNPDGSQAIIPYRFLVTRTVEPEVTIGVGGPRYIFAGDTGTYSVALQNLGNVDAPYTYFTVGIPEMGTNIFFYGLKYLNFESNVEGAPDTGGIEGLPWATLDSTLNLNGTVTTSGYLLNEPAGGFTGFTFNVDTYPGLKELHDHDGFDQLKAVLYAMYPELAATDALKDGPAGLDQLQPGLSFIWDSFGAIPDLLHIPLIPFEFNIVAAATSLTRDEFIALQLQEADRLRAAIIADPDASPALSTLAADQSTWDEMYLASLEETGLLLPDGTTPPVRTDPKIISVVATLSAGILAGPAGQQQLTTGSLSDFFDQVRTWYGNNPDLMYTGGVPQPTFTSDSLGFFGILNAPTAVPGLPTFDQYNLGLSLPTTFQAFDVYVPWVSFESRAAGIPADYAISGITPNDTQHFFPLNLDQFYATSGAYAGAASISGPFTTDTGGFVPTSQPLPFTVNFQNDPAATTYSHEVRVTVPLDPNVDAETFQLGDIKVGNITIHVPAGRSLFQGDFDFTQSNGFILRVSAGVDLRSHAATWLLQAIDPLTGQLLRDSTRGLLPERRPGVGRRLRQLHGRSRSGGSQRSHSLGQRQRHVRQHAAGGHPGAHLPDRQRGAHHDALRRAGSRHRQLRRHLERRRR